MASVRHFSPMTLIWRMWQRFSINQTERRPNRPVPSPSSWLAQGLSLERAIIDGSVSRLRPILMTVSTTVLGLVPLAFGTTQIGGDGPPYAPMAISIIGGLVFSTLTSLFLVPYAYARLLGMRARWQRLRQHARAQVNRLLPG